MRVRQVRKTQAMAELARVNNFVSAESEKLEHLNDFCNTYTIKNQLMNVSVSSMQLENHNQFVGTLIKARATQEVRVRDFEKVLDSKRNEMYKLDVELNRLGERLDDRKRALRAENLKKQDMLMQDCFNSVKYYDR